MDLEAIQNAEAQVASVQAALDDAQRVLQAAERAQLAAEHAKEVAERSARLMRNVAIAAIVGMFLVAIVRRSRHSS